MTWDELTEKVNNFKNVKISNLTTEEQIKGYEKLGFTPEMMYHKCVEVYLKEYLLIKFNLNKTYLFKESPVEAIVFSKFYEALCSSMEGIFEYYKGNLDEIVEYLNNKTI